MAPKPPGMVIAREHQYAAIGARSSGVAMTERIHGAIHAGAFSIPHGEYAIDLRPRLEGKLLRSPYRCSGEFFVHAGDEANRTLSQKSICFP